MRKYRYFILTGFLGILATGCYSPYGRPDYTASGALAGGATGAIIGSMARHPGPGAVVGGAMGAVVGGLIGHGMDQAQEEQLRAQAPQTWQRIEQGQPLTVQDVKSLVKAGISDDLIISQIRNSRTVYHLNTADIIDLKNCGVSDKIIDFMINTPSQISSAEVAGVTGSMPPAPLPEPVYAPPYPNYVWVPGVWVWFGERWVWHGGYWHAPGRGYRHWR